MAEPLTPDSLINLTVENAAGQPFTTYLFLDTPVSRLAQEFLQAQGTPGQAVVELISGPPGGEIPRRLNLTTTLYDAGLGDDSILRIYAQGDPQ